MPDNLLFKHPILRTNSSEIKLGAGRVLARRLWNVINRTNRNNGRDWKAVGLAAIQIGQAYRVCVMDAYKVKLTLINPRLEFLTDVRWPHEEGCLSFPKEKFICWRCPRIRVSADNLDQSLEFGKEGPNEDHKDFFRACVVQHEVAHCYGLTPLDFAEQDFPSPQNWDKWSALLKEKNPLPMPVCR